MDAKNNEPVFLIALRVYRGYKRTKQWRDSGKVDVARPDKRKSVKGKIYINPADLPIKNGQQTITCYKTGHKYRIHPAIRTKFK